MHVNWKVIVAAGIIEAGLLVCAWKGAIPWHTPVGFTVGVLMPTFGFIKPGNDGGIP